MGVELKFRIEGLEELSRLAERAPQAVEKELQAGMQKTVLYLQGRIPDYPPVPDESRYRRTGTLGRSLTAMRGEVEGALSEVQPLTGSARGLIGTAIPYAQYVIGETQAAAHAGRWWKLTEVIRSKRVVIARILHEAVQRALERVRG